MAFDKFVDNMLNASVKVNSTTVLAPSQREILYKFYLGFAFTKIPSDNMKSTWVSKIWVNI